MDAEKARILIISFLVFINLLAFLMFALDKFRAVRREWRISVSLLFALSLAGGALGGLLSIYLFRHKTKTPLFKYGMPIVVLIQIAVIFICFGGYAK